MRRLLIYLKDYRRESILGPLFKLLEAGFELIVPLVVAAIIDRGIGGNNRGFIISMGLALAGLGLVGLVCSVTAQYFAARAAIGFSTELRHDLFAHIQTLSYADLDRFGSSGIDPRRNDQTDVRNWCLYTGSDLRSAEIQRL